MNIADRIISTATEFEGLVETRSNAAWDDLTTPGLDQRAQKFAHILRRAGHQPGWPYCMSFCEGIWIAAYEAAGASTEQVGRIREMLTPSVMASYTNAKNAGLITRTPAPGAVFFMQSGSSWQGHAGIVLRADASTHFRTIEANTSPGAEQNERDGGAGLGGVWRKRRPLAFIQRERGLHLRGFLAPLPVS